MYNLHPLFSWIWSTLQWTSWTGLGSCLYWISPVGIKLLDHLNILWRYSCLMMLQKNKLSIWFVLQILNSWRNYGICLNKRYLEMLLSYSFLLFNIHSDYIYHELHSITLMKMVNLPSHLLKSSISLSTEINSLKRNLIPKALGSGSIPNTNSLLSSISLMKKQKAPLKERV